MGREGVVRPESAWKNVPLQFPPLNGVKFGHHRENPFHIPSSAKERFALRSDRRSALALVVPAFATFLCALLFAAAACAQAAPGNKVVFQVSDGEPAKWALTLNNVKNVQAQFGAGNVEIEIVAYGPGIGMLKVDSVAGNQVRDAIAGGVSIVACENTMRNQKLSREDMLPAIGYVPAGVVELIKRQQLGWSYIRP